MTLEVKLQPNPNQSTTMCTRSFAWIHTQNIPSTKDTLTTFFLLLNHGAWFRSHLAGCVLCPIYNKEQKIYENRSRGRQLLLQILPHPYSTTKDYRPTPENSNMSKVKSYSRTRIHTRANNPTHYHGLVLMLSEEKGYHISISHCRIKEKSKAREFHKSHSKACTCLSASLPLSTECKHIEWHPPSLMQLKRIQSRCPPMKGHLIDSVAIDVVVIKQPPTF